jgi:Domain of unknown function (DUF5666)
MSARAATVFRVLCLAAAAAVLALPLASQPAPAATRVLGTVQGLSGRTVTVLSDAGVTTTVAVDDSAKLLQLEPGKTDLKEAAPLAFSDLEPGDRVLVRGVLGDDGKTLRAVSLVAMKKAAISEKQARERAEWQHGIGGLVKSIDREARTLQLTTNGFSSKKEVQLRLAKDAVLRRYSPDSTRFDAAKPAPLAEVRPGDQLRARGSREKDGSGFEAVEIVSGTFRNIAGVVASTDPRAGTLVVQDLVSNTAVPVRITAESQMRKLPAAFAERLAARLKSPSASENGSEPPGARRPEGGAAETPPGGRGSGDFQQLIARMPPATLSDLAKGDVVMVVATQGNGRDPATVVTLLGGVEAILRASPGGQDMVLSPWSLGGGEPSPN